MASFFDQTVDHPLVAHHLGHLDRGHVQAVGERLAQGHVAEVLVLVVLRDVLLVFVEEDGGSVLHHRGRSDGRQGAVVEGGLEGGEVDEGLERAARLAVGLGHPVVLARAVGAPAHEGHHRAGSRLEGDEAALHGRGVLALDHLLHVRRGPGSSASWASDWSCRSRVVWMERFWVVRSFES